MTKLQTLLLSISTIGAFATTNAVANVDKDLGRCALSALASKQVNIKSMSVTSPSNDANQMDHDASDSTREYRMKLSSKVAGTDLGLVTCKIDQSGEVMWAEFVSAR